MSEVLVFRPQYQSLVTGSHLDCDEDTKSDNESGTDAKLYEELVNLEDYCWFG